ncbi:MAG: 4-(cytidine 5'-diphospho)-2-C-methyl-D-erythritol kinase [bacterium]
MIKINAPAKINLALKVVCRREDGYHNIETLFQTIDLYDELYLSPIDSGVLLSMDRKDLDMGEKNLIHKAATRLLEFLSFPGGVKIHLNKRIPIGAGLGGGSSDAAATLMGIVKLYEFSISERDIHSIASSLGADVPFFLNGPTAFGYGIGDIIEPSPPLPPFWIVLVKPNFSISTAWAYQKYDSRLTKSVNKIKIIKSAIEGANYQEIGKSLFNDLESVCFPKYPVLAEIKRELLSLGSCGALMSGSGASVFGLFSEQKPAHRAWRSIISSKISDWEVFLCRTIPK